MMKDVAWHPIHPGIVFSSGDVLPSAICHCMLYYKPIVVHGVDLPWHIFLCFVYPYIFKKSKTAFRQDILNSSLHSHRKCSFEYKLPVSVIDSSHQLAGFLWQWQAECQTQWWGRQSSPAAKWSWMKLSLHCLVADRNPQCPSPLRRCWAAAGSRCRIMVAVGSPPGRFSLESS